MSRELLTGAALFNDLRKIIDFPDNVIAVTLKLSLNAVAEIDCTFYAQRRVDVTTLESRARQFEFHPGGEPVTKRFRLVDTEPAPPSFASILSTWASTARPADDPLI